MGSNAYIFSDNSDGKALVVVSHEPQNPEAQWCAHFILMKENCAALIQQKGLEVIDLLVSDQLRDLARHLGEDATLNLNISRGLKGCVTHLLHPYSRELPAADCCCHHPSASGAALYGTCLLRLRLSYSPAASSLPHPRPPPTPYSGWVQRELSAPP